MENVSSNMDKTQRVAQVVWESLLKGDYQPGDRIPTEREMAENTRTSRVTVRRAYAELERTGILERRQGHGTRIAKTMRGSREDLSHVAVVMDARGPFAMSLLRSLETEATRLDALLVCKLNVRDGGQLEQAAVDLAHKGVHHLLIWPGDGVPDLSTFERLRILGTNMVFFDRYLPGRPADFVGLDNEHAVQILLDHARECGFEEIDFTGYSGERPTSEVSRLEAYMRWCARHKLEGRHFAVTNQPDREPELSRAVEQGLGRGRRKAVLCVHDELAIQVVGALGRSDGVYGIDGDPSAVAAGITTVKQPLERMVKTAFRLLREQQNRGDKWRPRVVRCRGVLVVPNKQGAA